MVKGYEVLANNKTSRKNENTEDNNSDMLKLIDQN